MKIPYRRNNKAFAVIRVYDCIGPGHTAEDLWGHQTSIAAVVAALGSDKCLELSRHDEPNEAEEAAYAHREAMSKTGTEEYSGVNQASYY